MNKSTWPATLESVRQLRKYVQAETLKYGIDEKSARQLALAVEEVTANIVHYAYGKPADGKIDITIQGKPSRITLQIIDQGKPFNPVQAQPPDIQVGVEERRIGGLGLLLVRNIADDIVYDRKMGRNHLTIVKYIQGDPSHAR